MDPKKKKFLIPLLAIIIIIAILIPMLIILLQPPPIKNRLDGDEGVRKAIILCSANDFYGTDVELHFTAEGDFGPVWELENEGAWNYGSNPGFGNYTPNALYFEPVNSPPAYSIANYTYNYVDRGNKLMDESFYILSASVYLNTSEPIIGPGARVGIQWLNGSGVVRIDWSRNINSTLYQWRLLSVMSQFNNNSIDNITEMKLVLSVKGIFMGVPTDRVYFDDVFLERWDAVNKTDPTNPNTNNLLNTDGFPAQALQVYKTLKNHQYTDDNIFLMLYHTGDDTIDIETGDGISNDLTGVIIDVENDDVNATRFKQELNVSETGSFASQINPKDQLIIFMSDHGSNGILPDRNATFHFEADHSYIMELEFYNLVKDINCTRKLINVDSCYSGNFLNEQTPIGASWYNLTNCTYISSSADLVSWYWSTNQNGDGWAGSWFFHPFWSQLDQGQSISNAFNFAFNFIPAGHTLPVGMRQSPLIYDNMGIINTWSFNGPILL